MNHQLAIETRATERYMLGELDDDSRSAFEEHYFSCRSCAQDVKAVAVFVDNARAVMAEEEREDARPMPAAARPAPPPFWGRLWVPAALAAALAIGYLAPHPARVDTQGYVASLAVPAGVRGAGARGAVIAVPAAASIFLVRLDVADDVTAARLSWRVRTADGSERSFQSSRENQVTLPLRAADFTAGRQYEVVLSEDTPGTPVIDRYSFSVQAAP